MDNTSIKNPLLAEPGATMQPSTEQVARNLRLFRDADDAFNRRDWDYLKNAHHPDLVAYTAGGSPPLRGHEQLSAMLGGMLKAFPDMAIGNHYPLQFGDGAWTSAMARVTGTFNGTMSKPDGSTIPGTGKAFDVWMVTNARWEDEQLIEEWVFWDTQLLAQQIGLA